MIRRVASFVFSSEVRRVTLAMLVIYYPHGPVTFVDNEQSQRHWPYSKFITSMKCQSISVPCACFNALGSRTNTPPLPRKKSISCCCVCFVPFKVHHETNVCSQSAQAHFLHLQFASYDKLIREKGFGAHPEGRKGDLTN